MIKGGLSKIVSTLFPLKMKTLLTLMLIVTLVLLFSILDKNYRSREYFGSATPAQPGTTTPPVGTVPDKRSVEVFLFLDYSKPVLTDNGKFIDSDWPELVVKYKNYPNVKIEKRPVSSIYNYFSTNQIFAEAFKAAIADPVKYPQEIFSPILMIAYVETKNNSLIQRQIPSVFGCKPTDINTTMKSVDEAIKSALSANRV
jgi:hypothetical protein